jgi:heterotetrameric sarcosine oxidase gamma subunit
VRITERQDLSMASILARRGASTAAIGDAIVIDMPVGPAWVERDGLVVVGSGPGTWLAYGRGVGSDWSGDLERRLAGLASVSDQTGAYRVLQIEGPDARTLLQRGAAVDLDGSAFPVGSACLTVIGHVDVIIRSLTDGRSYEVAVYRSYAESFLRWIDAAVAGF